MSDDFKGLMYEIKGVLENQKRHNGDEIEQTLTKLDAFLEAVPDNLTMHVKLMAIGDATSAQIVLETAQLLSTITEKEECR